MHLRCVVVGVALAACHPRGTPASLDASSAADATLDSASSVDTQGACAVDTDCVSAHEVCDTVAPRACVCAAGYTADAGGACAWTGVIANPGFSESGSWTGQTIDTTDMQPGLVDPGTVQIDTVTAADVLQQTFPMPRRSRAEPLVATVRFDKPVDDLATIPSFGIGTAWHYELPTGTTGWETLRFCLGEAEYAPESSTGRGAPRTITFMADPPGGTDLDDPDFSLDHVEIVPADPGECPDPGVALNGDGEGTGGWQTFLEGGGTFSIDAGAGANGSHGIHVHAPTNAGNSSIAEAWTHVSIPLGGSPALSFYRRVSGIDGYGALRVTLGAFGESSYDFSPLIDNTAAGVEHLCVPAALRGNVVQLDVDLSTSSTTSAADAVFDDFAIVDDPACGTDTAVTDPGFDAPDPVLDVAIDTPGTQVYTAQDPSLAHTGSGVLVIAEDAACNGATVGIAVSEPAVTTEGAAIAYYYKVAASSETVFAGGAPIVQDGAWHQAIACLPPLPAGHDAEVRLGLVHTAATCQAPITAYVDDISLTTDPSCPVK